MLSRICGRFRSMYAKLSAGDLPTPQSVERGGASFRYTPSLR
ncbi:MAG: hypothetical protein ACFNYM_08830 [Bacteroidota bacterium]